VRLDRRNVLVVSIAVVVGCLMPLWFAVVASRKADDVRIEHLRTEQERITACETVEDDEVRALCIVGAKP
jgi:hypothetical protein